MASASASSGDGHEALVLVAHRFGWLGLTSLGPPSAQLARLRGEAWRASLIDDAAFSSLVALLDDLPGMTTVQMSAALGALMSEGPQGALVAAAAYGGPSALMMGLIGLVGYRSSESGEEDEGDEDDEGGFGGRLVMSVQMGLGAAAVALLAHTAQRLQGSLAKREERAVCVATAALAVCAPTLRWTLPTLLLGAAGAGLLRRWSILRARGLLRRDGGAASADAAEATVPCQPALEHARDAQDGAESAQGGAHGGDERAGEYEERVAAVRAGRDPERVPTVPIPVPPAWALACAVLWVGVLVALLLLRASPMAGWPERILEPSYRSAMLLWAEGHAALVPFVLREAAPMLVPRASLLGAIALAHALPGPAMLSLGAFVGASYAGPLGSVLGFVAMHAPSLLATLAALPHWERLRGSLWLRAALGAVHAASTGIVLAAALLVFSVASTPPQQAIALITFASHHSAWPASALRVPTNAHGALTVAMGGALGVPFCLPWLMAAPSPPPPGHTTVDVAAASPRQPGGASVPVPASPTDAVHPGPAAAAAVTMQPPPPPPPPPAPNPPDPSPPPPPWPEPPAEVGWRE
jgi:chromate transport protein ChrA